MSFLTAAQAHAMATSAANAPLDQHPIAQAIMDPIQAAAQGNFFTVTINLSSFPVALIARAVTRLTAAGYTASTDATGLVLTVSW